MGIALLNTFSEVRNENQAIALRKIPWPTSNLYAFDQREISV